MADSLDAVLLSTVNGIMVVIVALVVAYHCISAQPADAQESDAAKATFDATSKDD